jgi:cytochrome oxidase assembly protein ShyY1
MLLSLGGTAALGLWQYSVAHRDDLAREVLAKPAIELGAISALGEYVPESSYGQLVSASGVLKCSESFVVKPLAISELWRVCPLILDDGTRIAIAFVADRKESALNEKVSLQGRLQPAQESDPLPAMYTIASEVPAINTDDLVLRWKSDVRDGYVVAKSITTSAGQTTEFSEIPQTQIVTPPVGIDIRNLMYAWQWWIFGLFFAFLYGRFVRDEIRVNRK